MKTDVFNYPYVCDGSIKKVDEHTNENFDLNTKKKLNIKIIPFIPTNQ